MSTCRKRGNSWEFIIKVKAVREKPYTFTFQDKEEGQRYCDRLEAMLRQGLVPPEMVEANKEFEVVGDVIRVYLQKRAVKENDKALLNILFTRIGAVRLSTVNYAWVERWIETMKVGEHLAPSTIRHYVGALARCFDWGSNRGLPELAINPLRLLHKGYASYTDHDKTKLKAAGKEVKEDEFRDRRLEPGEEERIRAILAGAKPEGRERPLTLRYQAALECLFELALESAMRMREIYTLEKQQVSFPEKTIFLERTKNGDKRQVPMTSVAIRALNDYMKHCEDGTRGMECYKLTEGRLFPWWSGSLDQEELKKVTYRLSQQFSRIFAAADCETLRFHDLRHEATSRLFEKTKMSDAQIMKITGHKGVRMVLRYANLRGSNLADMLW